MGPHCGLCYEYFNGLVQDCSNSSALAMELLQSWTKPSICSFMMNPYSAQSWLLSLYPHPTKLRGGGGGGGYTGITLSICLTVCLSVRLSVRL